MNNYNNSMFSFSTLLKHWLIERNLGLREFARRAKPYASESSSASYVSKVLSGSGGVAPRFAEEWADVLSLSGEDRSFFLDMALTTHLPVERRQRGELLVAGYHEMRAREQAYLAAIAGVSKVAEPGVVYGASAKALDSAPSGSAGA